MAVWNLMSTLLIALSVGAIPRLSKPAILNCNRNSQFEDVGSLYHEVAIIGSDDRAERNPGDLAANVEAAQGRIWCHHRGPTPKKNQAPPDKDHLRSNYSVVNAFLAFEDDMAVINRHTLVDALGKPRRNVKDCFFEHIQSGELIALTDSAYPPVEPGSNVEGTDKWNIKGHKDDIALVKLSRKPTGGRAILEREMNFNDIPDPSTRLKVVSNYAKNTGDRESLTMTSCQAMGQYSFKGAPLNVYPSDCDTGEGSSGAQVYIEVNGQPKLTGIITGERKNVPEGGSHDPKDLTTIFTTFNGSLLKAYKELKNRREI